MEVLNNQNQKNRQKQDETTEFYNNPNKRFLSTIKDLTQVQISIREFVALDNSFRVDRWILNNIKTNWISSQSIDNMTNSALDYYKLNKSDFEWSLDSVIILWALVFIYDSSKNTPKYFKDKSRWDKKTIFHNWEYFSVIWIDVNESKRKDKVTPTTSLHHELQHHLNTTIWDKMISKNDFLEANRHADPPKWFRSKSDWISQKTELIWKLFWRKVDLNSPHPAIKSKDYQDYEAQLFYLDELSASFWQCKSEVFWPTQLFYNNLNPKARTHYEIIWNNIQDKQDLKDIFQNYLMSWLYLFELIKVYKYNILKLKNIQTSDVMQKSLNSAKIINYENKIKQLNYIISLITQTLWISRNVNQAKSLLKNIWENDVLTILNQDEQKYIVKGSKALKDRLL